MVRFARHCRAHRHPTREARMIAIRHRIPATAYLARLLLSPGTVSCSDYLNSPRGVVFFNSAVVFSLA